MSRASGSPRRPLVRTLERTLPHLGDAELAAVTLFAARLRAAPTGPERARAATDAALTLALASPPKPRPR